MSATLTFGERAALNPAKLARKAIGNLALLPTLIEGLSATKANTKFGSARALCLVSEQSPAVLHPYFDDFVRLLDHENKILQWSAIFVLSQLARVDTRDRFATIFKRYFSPIPGPVMITAANVIRGGARVAQAKPELADRIAAEILKVARARYDTPECRNVAIGHAILALGDILPLLRDPAPAVRFVRRQKRNPRPATREKAEEFLKLHNLVPRLNSAR